MSENKLNAAIIIALMALAASFTCVTAQENNAGYWLNKGDELYMARSYEEAIEAYDNATQIDSRNAKAWLGMGHALDNLAFIDHGTNDSDNFAKTLERSIQAFDRALELDPQNAYAWHGKGVTLIHLGRHKEAQTGKDKEVMDIYGQALYAINKAIEINPKTKGAQENRANLLGIIGKQGESAEAYEKIFEEARSPQEQSKALYNKANFLRAQGRFDEALETFDKAIELDPQGTEGMEARTDKGDTLLVMGRLNESLETFNEAIEIDPDNAIAWRNKGLTLKRMGRYNESIEAYEKTLKIDPNNSLAWAGMSEVLETLGRTSEAEKTLAKAREHGYSG